MLHAIRLILVAGVVAPAVYWSLDLLTGTKKFQQPQPPAALPVVPEGNGRDQLVAGQSPQAFDQLVP